MPKPMSTEERWEKNEARNRSFNERVEYLKNIPQDTPHVMLLKKLVDEAIYQNKWLFDPVIKRWHTPEDYFELRKNTLFDGSKDLDKIQIRDPMDGVMAADQIIEDTMSRKKILVQRIAEYYQAKASKR